MPAGNAGSGMVADAALATLLSNTFLPCWLCMVSVYTLAALMPCTSNRDLNGLGLALMICVG